LDLLEILIVHRIPIGGAVTDLLERSTAFSKVASLPTFLHMPKKK
jgi:hypothetical protein